MHGQTNLNLRYVYQNKVLGEEIMELIFSKIYTYRA